MFAPLCKYAVAPISKVSSILSVEPVRMITGVDLKPGVSRIIFNTLSPFMFGST